MAERKRQVRITPKNILNDSSIPQNIFKIYLSAEEIFQKEDSGVLLFFVVNVTHSVTNNPIYGISVSTGYTPIRDELGRYLVVICQE